MATKSIHTIEIDDVAFKEFQGRFAKYQQALQKTSPAWKKVDEAIKAAKGTNDKLRLTMAGTAFQIKQAETAQKKFTIAAQGTGRAMGIVAKSTGTIAKNVAKTTLSLLKWVSLGSLFSGLLGTGSLFGIDRLARSASDSRRQSQGLGIGAAELKSAQLNFSKFTDVDSALGNVAGARGDLSKRWIFSALGIDPEKGSNVDILGTSLKAAKHSFESNGMTQQGADAHGLTQLYSMDDLRRLHAMTDQEIDDAVTKQKSDRDALAITDKTQRSWQDLNIQLSRAGASLENQLINKLATLTGPLGRLSDSVSKAFEAFLNTPKIGGWIDGLGDGIQRFSKYLASDEFKSDIDDFVDDLKTLREAISSLAEWIKKLFPAALPGAKDDKGNTPKSAPGTYDHHAPHTISQGAAETLHRIANAANSSPDAAPGQREKYGKAAWYNGWNLFAPDQPPGARSVVGKITYGASSQAKYLESLEKKYGNPDGILDRVWWAESNRGKRMLSSKGAAGHFGFMPATAKEYGLDDPNDFNSSAASAARKIKNLQAEFHGDIEKSMAAYNWGDGNLKKDIAKYGDNWKDHLPSETEAYIKKTTDGLVSPGMSHTNIEIRNNTGGSAVVTTNALAY
jgi:hypothetical protein